MHPPFWGIINISIYRKEGNKHGNHHPTLKSKIFHSVKLILAQIKKLFLFFKHRIPKQRFFKSVLNLFSMLVYFGSVKYTGIILLYR